ncbi:hypothetical protein MAM1_0014c01394 [Mucor ambiguus]|uniref:F-box domain-containing protein n=1 Tax=Mucor ambiguus TaxID=91626 RepID=A0A0C9MFR1_9FUNG|nr:hypothetical protein MAM1_0014c01394 [Mucor ambiguus]
MQLFQLPNELLQMISTYLPRQSIARLCSTSIAGYQLFLPRLYRHVELGHRTHIKQLEQGLQTNTYLKETVKAHTQILTLKCRQGGNSHWLIISLFEQLPNVKRLCFRDFLALSVQKVRQVLLTLPQLTHLDFQYCELTAAASAATWKTKSMPMCHLPNLKNLNLLWTDFSAEAIRQLFSFTPNLDRVILGANHNRKAMANDAALQYLTEHCTQIKDLSISLQQVKEASLCQVIQVYGPQLQHLSIRCEGNDTLWAISQHTKQLRQLVIRCSNYTGGYHSVMHVLQDCRSLQHLEMVSWPLHDMPSIVLDQIRYKASNFVKVSSTTPTAPALVAIPTNMTITTTASYIEGIKRTVALDKQDLQEIRRLCLY